jgi:NAD(P)-dependent dehydrogenase (short-subunit alcohol dehydrogenase family)
MQISLAGKVAIVTGVSGDGQVGQAVAKALAENGAQLAICARKQSNVEARAKELRDAGAGTLSRNSLKRSTAVFSAAKCVRWRGRYWCATPAMALLSYA